MGWTGSSTSTFGEVEITMNIGKYLTAVLKTLIVDENNIFVGVGKWKINVLKEVTEKFWKIC